MPPEVVAQIGSPRGRHFGPVNCMAYSPDGTLLVTGGYFDGLKVWDTVTLRQVGVLECCTDPRLLAFNADGNQLAASAMPRRNDDVRIWVWERKGKSFRCLDPEGYRLSFSGRGIMALALSPNGATVATTDYKSVHLWDLTGEAAQERGSFTCGVGSISSLAFSPSGRELAVRGDTQLELCDLRESLQPITPTEPSLPLGAFFVLTFVFLMTGPYWVIFWILALDKKQYPVDYRYWYSWPKPALARLRKVFGWVAALAACALILGQVIRVPSGEPGPCKSLWKVSIAGGGWPGATLAFSHDGRKLAAG
jgi:hypothetical protein